MRLEDTEPDWIQIRPVIDRLESSDEWHDATRAIEEYVRDNSIEPPGFIPNDVRSLYVAPLLRGYLGKLKRLRWNASAARASALELMAHLRAPAVEVSGLLVLDGFRAERAFRLGAGIEIRPITRSEIIEIGPESSLPMMIYPARPTPRTDWWVCSIRIPNPRGTADGFNAISPTFDQVQKLLRVFKASNILFWHADTRVHGLYGRFGRHSQIASPYFGHATDGYVISRSEATRLIQLWQVARPVLEKDHHYLQLPLRRLQSGVERTNLEDKLVDYVVGLEALLGLASERDALGYRIRVRGSVVLGKKTAERREHLQKLRAAYELRSRIVHGSRVPAGELAEATDYCEKALRQVWRWFFDRHRDDPGNERGVGRIDDLLVTV